MILQFNDLVYLLTGNDSIWLSEHSNAAIVLSILFGLAFFCPSRFRNMARLSYLRPLENALTHLARRRSPAILIVGVFALTLNAAISLFGQIPAPSVQDEFSYLLAADTFAHGRWTNPTHPFWIHFESFHIIHQPSYASKYPPGQGLMLAIGQILCGLPIAGSWLGTAFACMAMCWAFQQWLPNRIALLGGLLAVVHPVMIYWAQSYWGCQWAIAGGALAIGALRSFSNKNHRVPVAAGWIFGVGCSLLIITRPSEGTALSGLMLIYIGWQWHKSQLKTKSSATEYSATRISRGALAPIIFLFCCTLAFWGHYNYQVTGNVLRMPYAIHEKTYGMSPLFIWQNFKPEPVYHHRELRISHVEDETPAYMSHRTPQVLLEVTGEKLLRLWLLLSLSATLAAGTLLWPIVYWRDHRMRLLFGLLAILIFVLLLEVWLLPHYTTPLVALSFILALRGWQRLRVWHWHGRPSGLFLARAVVLLSFLSLITSIALLKKPDSDGIISPEPGLRRFSLDRAQLTMQLERAPGQDLILVHYSPDHHTGKEWVYNAADIEGAPIVWARAMTPERDAQLMNHFQSRNFWRLDADENPPRLTRIK